MANLYAARGATYTEVANVARGWALALEGGAWVGLTEPLLVLSQLMERLAGHDAAFAAVYRGEVLLPEDTPQVAVSSRDIRDSQRTLPPVQIPEVRRG